MIQKPDFNGTMRRLVRDEDGADVSVGDRLPDFRGKMHTIIAAQAPHKPSSTGFVDTDFGSFYVSVLNLKWVVA